MQLHYFRHLRENLLAALKLPSSLFQPLLLVSALLGALIDISSLDFGGGRRADTCIVASVKRADFAGFIDEGVVANTDRDALRRESKLLYVCAAQRGRKLISGIIPFINSHCSTQ